MRFTTTYQRRQSRLAFLGKLRDALWNYPSTLVYLFNHLRKTRNIALFLLVCGILYYSYSYAFALIRDQRGIMSTITIGIVDTSSYSPLGSNTLSRLINRLVFGSLITVDEQGNPSPLLASAWDVKNNTTVILTLDTRNIWEDGKPFGPDDVIYSFEVQKKLNDKGPLAKATIKPLDSSHVEIDFSALDNNLWQDLLWPIFPNHPVISSYEELGTGPYVLKTKGSDEYHLQANTKYLHAPIANKEVVIKTFATEDDLYQAYVAGYINAYMITDPNAKIAHDLLNEQKSFIFAKDLSTTYNALFFNMDTLKDANIRKGIAYAINKKKMQTILSGYLTIQDGPISQRSWAFSFDTSFPTYPYSPDSALKAFQAAGYTLSDGKLYDKDANPLALTLSYPVDISHMDILNSIAQDLTTIGITLTLQPHTQDDWAQSVVLKKHFDMAYGQVQQPIDPDPYILWDTNSEVNISSYSNKTVDRILELARSTTDKNQRKQGYGIFSRYLMNDLPAVFLYSPTIVFEAKPNLKGIAIDKSTGIDVDIFSTLPNWYI